MSTTQCPPREKWSESKGMCIPGQAPEPTSDNTGRTSAQYSTVPNPKDFFDGSNDSGSGSFGVKPSVIGPKKESGKPNLALLAGVGIALYFLMEG